MPATPPSHTPFTLKRPSLLGVCCSSSFRLSCYHATTDQSTRMPTLLYRSFFAPNALMTSTRSCSRQSSGHSPCDYTGTTGSNSTSSEDEADDAWLRLDFTPQPHTHPEDNAQAKDESVPGQSGAALSCTPDAAQRDASTESNRRLGKHSKLVDILKEALPLARTAEIFDMLRKTKTAKEVRHIMEHVLYKHHLCFDTLNGHGFRVAAIQVITSVAPHTCCLHEWFDCMDKFRRLGFVITRTFAAEGFTLIRQWLSQQFNLHGRSPHLVTEGIAHIKELMHWCHEDALVFDHVLYTRVVFLLTLLVSYFDRQNLYRVTFPNDLSKRDGIVVDWTVTRERCVDFDECVLQCDAYLEELLASMRQDIPCRTNFSFLYRLIDYYFATDNVEKMVAVMEEANQAGVNVAESSTAKLMQLACALNYPQVPQLFMRWRVALPHCVLATPDVSRLLFYYSRSGGGRPCPLCSEPYNHRNVSVYRWLATPPHQRQCPALRMAREQKGELEECAQLPQNSDWSGYAFSLWGLSRCRSVEWGALEWRAFLLCCLFSSRALEAVQLLDDHYDHSRMDDFLRSTYIRVLRHHRPEAAVCALRRWRDEGTRMSPIALQEALMAASLLDTSALRLAALNDVWHLMKEKDTYVMPLTRRFLERQVHKLQQRNDLHNADERDLFRVIIHMKPRRLSLLDKKDSASDFVMGSFKKNVYIPPPS